MISLLQNLEIFFLSRTNLKSITWRIQIIFIISSLFELLGILLLGPLIFLATSGEDSLNHQIINHIFNIFHFESFYSFFLYFFSFTFFAILIGSVVSVYSVMLLSKIATKSGVNLGNKLLKHYLFLPWIEVSLKTTNHIINEIYQESSRVTQNILVPLLMINKYLLLSLFIILGLVFIDPQLTIILFLALVIIYFTIYLALRSRLYRNSELLTFAHEARLSYLSNVFDLLKQIKIWRNEEYFADGFNKASVTWGDSYRQNLNVALLPRYFVETLILLSASIVIFISFSSGIDTNSALPKLSIFLFSAFKLLPALQGVYYSSSQIRGNIYSLEQIIKTLQPDQATEEKILRPIENISSIRLKDVSFRYNDDQSFALNNISLELNTNKLFGITGKSGAGKSTFCDILMGFIKSNSGTIYVNEEELDIYENIEWFKKLSYAPPTPKLFNDSLDKNIFFLSKDVHDIDFLDDLVNLNFLDTTDLSSQDALMNFSAGELQRLGLARALARKNPELIILDEPSSALDNVNRSIFIEKLKKIKDNKIILLITHDLELLKELDQIIVFEDGKIDIFDDFDEAVSKSSELNKLLNV